MKDFQFIALNRSELIVFGLLTISIVSVWLPWKIGNKRYAYPSLCLFSLALLSALFYEYIDLIALPAIVVFALGFIFLRYQKALFKFFGVVIITVLSVGFMTHGIPGFHNPSLVRDVVISEGAIRYSLYLNFDKAIIGCFFLFLGTVAIRSKDELRISLKTCLVGTPLIAAYLLPSSFALGYVRLDPKFGSFFLEWSWINLFFTCLAEESFFRGFVQSQLSRLFRNQRYGFILSLTVSSLLFGSAHYAGGLRYIVLATMAGLGYGLVYKRTQHIEASVLTHFSVNSIHFLFFTYPALSRAVA